MCTAHIVRGGALPCLGRGGGHSGKIHRRAAAPRQTITHILTAVGSLTSPNQETRVAAGNLSGKKKMTTINVTKQIFEGFFFCFGFFLHPGATSGINL